MLYLLVTELTGSRRPECVTSLPSWSCGFDSRRPLRGPAIGLELLGGGQNKEEPLGWRVPVLPPSPAGRSPSAVTRSKRSAARPSTTPGVRPHRRANPEHTGADTSDPAH